MEVKELYGFTLMIVLVGMVIGVGVLALDKFSTATKTSTTVYNETITITAGAGTFANDDVTEITYFGNFTTGWSTDASYTIGTYVNLSGTTGIKVSSNFSNANYNVSYKYLKDTAATTATQAGLTEVSGISTTWLGLIVTIVILAIIIGLVIRSFGFGGQQR